MWSSPAVPKLRYGFMLYRRATLLCFFFWWEELRRLKQTNMLVAIWLNHCFEDVFKKVLYDGYNGKKIYPEVYCSSGNGQDLPSREWRFEVATCFNVCSKLDILPHCLRSDVLHAGGGDMNSQRTSVAKTQQKIMNSSTNKHILYTHR